MTATLDKVAALLRQSESAKSGSPEAEAYMAAAQRMATAAAISLEVARQHADNKDKREEPVKKMVTLGQRGMKGLKFYVELFTDIGRQNDIRCDIAHNSTYVIAYGLPSDIDMTELLYASLVTQMVEASNKYLATGEYKSEYAFNTKGDYRPIDGRVARASFQTAFIRKINARLRDARLEAIQAAKSSDEFINTIPESVNTNDGVKSGMEMVLVNKSIEIHDFYKAKSSARGTWQGGRSSSGHSNSASNAGTVAGSRATISRSKAITS